ncbi:PLP-dependent aspartate aminotransferase family protein [Agromyces mediolanus]|uniref:trans-sulfuration enzyme family protein n=1 Tax=Agromyces mediolanus TaxID=41986 RepID=UPI00203BEC05|nr:PLP-dependent aspartate aminotransferase family protein [Agromyces mediolanus]MCM3658788.1 PLP-dependent aspartate aminotransferase family protein [Agromyces mediolanus]
MTQPPATESDDFQRETVAVVAGRPAHTPDEPLNTPLHLASTYVAGGALEYGRYGNPSWTAFEEALGALEGGRAVSFGSGIAAVDAVLELVPHGGLVVAPRHSYTGTVLQLDARVETGRIRVAYVDVTDTAAVAAACEGAALLWFESPTNPALELGDVPALVAGAHAHGALVAIDNTFATPLRQRPIADGADLVVHSATKYLAGHSDVIMGAVVTADAALAQRLVDRRSLGGAIPSAFEAFLALRGLRTLHVRLDRAERNARDLVERLAGHPALDEVRYPGFGAVISLVVAGGAPGADRFVAAVRLWVHATSLGGVESTLERRRRWAAEADTIPAGLVRLSVGIEHVDDLAADLLQALDAAR